MKLHFGIRARLLFALLSLSSITVVTSAVGWLFYSRLGNTLTVLDRQNLPAVALATRLAEEGGALTAIAPVLASADNPAAYRAATAALRARLTSMRHLLGLMNSPGFPAPEAQRLSKEVDAIVANFSRLDKNVGRRFVLAKKNADAVQRLLWLQADFLDEVNPLVADARFNSSIALHRALVAPRQDSTGPQMDVLREESVRSEGVLKASAAGNLAIGLLARISEVPDEVTLHDDTEFLGETFDELERNAASLKGWPESITLRQIIGNLIKVATGPDGLVAIRRQELATIAQGQALLLKNRMLVGELNRQISQEVAVVQASADTAADGSLASLRQGRQILLLVAMGSLLVSGLITWLYVDRNLISRITGVSVAARSIAKGNLQAPIPTGGGDEIADMAEALVVFRDTAILADKAQRQLIQSAKLAALGQLTAGIGHELNQPIAAIRTYAHNGRTLIERERFSEAGENFRDILALVARINEITTSMKRFARQAVLACDRVEVGPVVRNALALFGNRIREEAADVEVRLPAQELAVIAEEVRLQQVLVNILSNALDALTGQPARRIILAARADGELVEITISDTGVGIPEDIREQVFDPFFTTKPPGAGLGLGMSISYNIVRDFGGVLVIASTEPGGGTVVSITLNRA